MNNLVKIVIISSISKNEKLKENCYHIFLTQVSRNKIFKSQESKTGDRDNAKGSGERKEEKNRRKARRRRMWVIAFKDGESNDRRGNQ